MSSFHAVRQYITDCDVSAIPASALNEEEDEEEDEVVGESRDDERTGTRYNVCHTPQFCLMTAHRKLRF